MNQWGVLYKLQIYTKSVANVFQIFIIYGLFIIWKTN